MPTKDPKLPTELDEPTRRKIMNEVALGGPPPAGETGAAAEFRRQCVEEVTKDRAQGFAPEYPWDAHDPA